MITRETAERIWRAYREIETAEKLLKDMAEVREQEFRWEQDKKKHEPTLKDAFGRRQHLQLGIPSGESSHRLFNVSPQLADSVIKAHIANKQKELVEAQESARIELMTDCMTDKATLEATTI